MTEKITSLHLQRPALVYVRQSTPQQVYFNEQSRRLQYAMKERLHELGWSQIEIIDDDLGRTASGVTQRPGFERMITRVSLGEIGAVAAREVSRFARNNRQWYPLLEICGIVNTLLIDHETIFDPRNSNDRLLLGLKGNLSAYELDQLRHRALEARRAKARRGELYMALPPGFIKTDDGRVEKDRIERVQHLSNYCLKKHWSWVLAVKQRCGLSNMDSIFPFSTTMESVGKRSGGVRSVGWFCGSHGIQHTPAPIRWYRHRRCGVAGIGASPLNREFPIRA